MILEACEFYRVLVFPTHCTLHAYMMYRCTYIAQLSVSYAWVSTQVICSPSFYYFKSQITPFTVFTYPLIVICFGDNMRERFVTRQQGQRNQVDPLFVPSYLGKICCLCDIYCTAPVVCHLFHFVRDKIFRVLN